MSLWAKLSKRLGTRRLLPLLNLYPPYLGAGIRVRPGGDDLSVTAELRLRRLNKNFVGTHFGGSLYAMCDPFFVLLVAGQLGPGYLVLDKSATIRFKKPGRGSVRATFAIAPAELAEIRRALEERGKLEPTFSTVVTDEDGAVVAEVEKTLYLRKVKGTRLEARLQAF